LTSRDYYGGIPVWSPNGEKFVIALAENVPQVRDSADELYIITSDGYSKRITYLTEQYAYVDIGEYSWSPDGRYIAFWLTIDPRTDFIENLAVIDTQALILTSYCIPGKVGGGSGAHYPIWSPDGKQLVVENITNSDNQINVLLVDIQEGIAVNISHDMTPEGWMVNP
jgi:Tol biopolymer transport system component